MEVKHEKQVKAIFGVQVLTPELLVKRPYNKRLPFFESWSKREYLGKFKQVEHILKTAQTTESLIKAISKQRKEIDKELQAKQKEEYLAKLEKLKLTEKLAKKQKTLKAEYKAKTSVVRNSTTEK